MNGARRALAVARLELHALLCAPVVYVLGALFLVVQGASFASLVAQMADPARPAPLGAVLEAQLGGTALGWSLWAMVLALLAMRALAEARKTGEWEALVTAGVSERAAVLGKWLALTALLGVLWLPTAAYLGVIALYQQGGAAWDLGSIASGYLGVWAIGAALLGVALAASAAVAHPLVAGALGYFALLVLILVGELPAIAPELLADAPSLGRVAAALSLRGHAAALGRGEVTATALAWIAALAGVGLSAAVALAGRGRRRPAESAARGLATALLALAGGLAVALAARSGASWDVSARARNTLDDATLAVLAELDGAAGGGDGGAEVVIIEPTLGALQPIFEHAGGVLARMQRRQPRLSIRRLDPAALPGGLAAAARQAGVSPDDLASSGALVVRVGGRQRVLDFFEIAELTSSAAGPELLRWSVERAVAARLAELVRPAPVAVCATVGHGELALEAAPGGAGGGGDGRPAALELAALVQRALDDGLTVTPLPDGPVPTSCQVVLVAAPRQPLPPAQALELARFVEAGGGLVVGLSSRALDARGELLPSGLELLLAASGLATPPAVAIDPDAAVAADGSMRILEGYDAHELNRGFARARATVWWTPRVLAVTAPAQPLVHGGARSWGEVDLVSAPPTPGEADVPGPAVVAGALDRADLGRVVVMGSMESVSSAVLAAGASALDLWMVRALRWAARRPLPAVPGSDRAPDQMRLLMTRGERRSVAVICAAVLPAAWLAFGLVLGGVRRRRGRQEEAGDGGEGKPEGTR